MLPMLAFVGNSCKNVHNFLRCYVRLTWHEYLMLCPCLKQHSMRFVICRTSLQITNCSRNFMLCLAQVYCPFGSPAMCMNVAPGTVENCFNRMDQNSSRKDAALFCRQMDKVSSNTNTRKTYWLMHISSILVANLCYARGYGQSNVCFWCTCVCLPKTSDNRHLRSVCLLLMFRFMFNPPLHPQTTNNRHPADLDLQLLNSMISH